MDKYCYRYPHPAVTVDCVIFYRDKDDLKVLLIRRRNEPYKDCWAFPGGFINIDESAEDAVKREIKEETDIELVEIVQLGAYSAPDRDPRERVITIAFISEVKTMKSHAGDDAKEAAWFSVNNLPPLAFDHSSILTDALSKFKE